MTSNIGSGMILENKGDADSLRDELMQELRRHFRPEFLNRVDETLVFHALGTEHMTGIADIQLRRFTTRLKSQNIGFEITDEAKRFIAEDGYDPSFGARPLKRAIIRLLENPVSRLIIEGKLSENMTLHVGLADGKLTFDAE